MSLLRLANELICCISENLESERDINAFVQANRRLSRLLDAYLYYHNIQKSGSSALLWAARHGQDATAQKLLVNRANNQAASDRCWAPLFLAAEKGHKGIVKLLLDKGTYVNAEGGFYGNALQAASAGGQEPVVKLLLREGADANAEGGFFGNALQAASYRGHKQVVELLLEKGANVNAQGTYYYCEHDELYESSALYAALQEGHDEIVRLLLDKGANADT